MSTVAALPAILDGQQLVRDVGLPLCLFIVFAETGLLLGFFLPGDSLLFAALPACSQHAQTRSLLQEQINNCQVPVVTVGNKPVDRLGFGFGEAGHLGICQIFQRRDEVLPNHGVVFDDEGEERHGGLCALPVYATPQS